MPEVRFDFSRKGRDAATGFDLGDVQVTGDQGSVTSVGQTPSQSMMIYVALVELLDGLSRLAKAGSGRYRFIGADSSFLLDFALGKAGLTITGRRATPVAHAPLSECLASVHAGLERFLSVPENQLSSADPVAGDLRAARQTFDVATRGAGA
jgi:hypothetical protein